MYYPFFIEIKDKKVLVVGGGRIGTKRALALKEHGANVTVVSKEFSDELKRSKIRLIKRDLSKKDITIKNFFLIVIATNNKKINEKICRIAKKKGILVNRADSHASGDVVFPMVSEISGHRVAFTTLGKNPKLCRKVKDIIENVSKNENAKIAGE